VRYDVVGIRRYRWKAIKRFCPMYSELEDAKHVILGFGRLEDKFKM
jgi:hypothetical protein